MRLTPRLVATLALVSALCGPAAARGDVVPHTLISDRMVFQRECTANVWGTPDAREVVSVRFRGQEVSTTTAYDGQLQCI